MSSVRDQIVALNPREPGELACKLSGGLSLLKLGEVARTDTGVVLTSVREFLRRPARVKRSKPSKLEAHTLAIELGVVVGHQLRKHGWQWIWIAWRISPVEPLKGYDRERETAEEWGLIRADEAFLVLPIYDLLFVGLHPRTAEFYVETVHRPCASPASPERSISSA
jgi:hypothetical protein